MFNEKHKELLKYILPSAGAMCVTYLYNIVDGIFVGQGVGLMALILPFLSLLLWRRCRYCLPWAALQLLQLNLARMI